MFVDIFQEDSVCVVLKGIAEVIRIMNVEIVSLEISVSLFLNIKKSFFIFLELLLIHRLLIMCYDYACVHCACA